MARAQLAELGFGAGAITYRRKIGRLHLLHSGVYAVGHRPPSPLARAIAAVLACGPHAALSHGSAAALWRITPRWPAQAHVTAPSERDRPGIHVHRSRHTDATTHYGIQVTTPARTLVDLADVLTMPGRTEDVVGWCAVLPGPVRVAYEAGPTGFGLARGLRAAGVECVVAAPGKIERPSSDRVKTDERDAERLLRLLMIGGLHPVRVPTREEEALRDLVRAREDVRGDLMRARHRLSKLLLRHDIRFDGTAGAWTTRHRSWLGQVDLGERGAQVTFSDYLGAIDALLVRRDSLESTISQLIPGSPWAIPVARLRCLRGIDTLSAVGLCCEVGDFARFARAGHVMSFLGLVPSEHTSGQTRRQGQITKTGSGHGRRLLVEAAWHYRRQPAKGDALKRRQVSEPPHVLAVSWHAQQRLHRTWQRLDVERGKRRTIVAVAVAVAVARELAGFCWAITNAD